MFEAELNFGNGLKHYRARTIDNLLKKATRAGGGNAYKASCEGADPHIILLTVYTGHPSGEGLMMLWEKYIHVPVGSEYETYWSARAERLEREYGLVPRYR